MSLNSKQKRQYRPRYLVVIIGFLSLFCTGANAALINSDFSAGFDNWLGDYTYYDFSADAEIDEFDVSVLPPALYSLNGGGSVSLMAAFYPEQDDETFFVSLFQEFVVDSLTAGNQLLISLSVLPALSNPVTDYFIVQLEDLSGSMGPLDLSSGGTFDITAWAGTSARLSFILEDSDIPIFGNDALTVSNLAITQVARDVPEPPVLGLFALAGLLLLRRKFN